ncbi:hypothetical protein QBC38DRAFT_461132 [Podospora fimiseda]|uniref:Uncharacterized protein n=1 Tax=Podospora fimiseda TaxID=252190 RepID=A0AAN6YPG5_9PEZI|nr:hypothetical protein QBC38DRAFT_461132 [Podospora fimiseda]
MCFQEFIAYQCGHRSLAVIRACPLTTVSPNLSLCSIQPVKQYFAETMCAACERQIHTRWVLIREWEHHWLHDRGACNCQVQYPAPVYAPKLVGADEETGDARGKGKAKEESIPYAVEWRADHRQRHKEGLYSCPARFASLVPRIPDDEIDTASKSTVIVWRDMEMRHGGYPPETGHVSYTSGQIKPPGQHHSGAFLSPCSPNALKRGDFS